MQCSGRGAYEVCCVLFMISNIKYYKKHTYRFHVEMQRKIRWRKMEHFFRSNVCIDSVSLPRLDNPTGACPTHRRQWADFLVSLMAPLHRQYKTARTETRRHLLLKTGQMPTQTSASRGYVLFRGVIRDTHKSPTNCLPGCGHDPRSAPNLERHGSSKMQTSGWLEMPHFLNQISLCISI